MQRVTQTRKHRRQPWTAAALSAAAIALVAGLPARPVEAEGQATPLPGDGRIWYEKYCTPCHGPGGAPGKAVFKTSKEPVDLRTYVQRHGGTFPSGDWLSVVFAETPHNPHTAIWDRLRRDENSAGGNETTARAKVRSIADYIVSIQEK